MVRRPFGCSLHGIRSTVLETFSPIPTTCLLAALTLTAANGPAAAQIDADAVDEGEMMTLEVDQISITANRTPTPLNQVGSAVTVITREDLEQRQTRILSDILREVPGVAVSRSGPVGTLTQVRIRGAEGNHTLVLINGIEANDPANGREFDFANLLASDIERIEIVRGPQSALYGSEAIGGVINIITRQGSGPLSADATVEGGSFGTVQTSAALRGGGDNYGFAGSVDFFRTDGIDISGTQGEQDGYRNLTANVTGHVEPTDNLRFDLAWRYTDAEISTDGQEFAFGQTVDSDINETERRQVYGLARGTLTLFDDQWEQIAGVSVTDTENDFTSAFGTSFADATLFDVNYQSNYYLETPNFAQASHIFTIFVEREETDFSNDTNRGIETVDYAFVGQYQVALFDQLFLGAAVRHDEFDGLQDFTTFRVTAAYELTDFGTRFHGSVGTGVQRPTPTEQFGFSPGNFVGNPDLEPEESLGWDIGVEQAFFDDRLIVDVTYFNADLENEITSTFDPTAPIPFSVDNADGESERQGVEVSLTASPLNNLDITASYTFTDAEDNNGLEEVRRAEHIASVNATYRFLQDRATVNLGVLYNGEQEDSEFGGETPETRVTLDDYTLVNLSGSYRVFDTVEVFGRIENLLDQDYEEVLNFTTPGIGAFAGLRVSM